MITIEQMLLSSVHLGHKIKQCNPKMTPYIFGSRNGIHIIDLLQTLVCLKKTCMFLRDLRLSNKKFWLLNIFILAFVVLRYS